MLSAGFALLCVMREDRKMNEYEMIETPPSIDVAIERAAQHLPDGCTITIEVEHGGYNVALSTPDRGSTQSVDGGDGIRSDINHALCIANGFDDA